MTPGQRHSVVVSLGSNVADCHALLQQASIRLAQLMGECQLSSAYFTEPLSGKGTPYLNAVAVGQVAMEVEEFNGILKGIETMLGRTDEARRRGEVPIDLDIVVADEVVLRQRDFQADFFRRGYSELTCTSSCGKGKENPCSGSSV